MPTEKDDIGLATAFVFLCATALILYRHSLLFLKLPVFREMLFVISVLQIAARENATTRPYSSEFDMIMLSGVPYQGSTLEKKILAEYDVVISLLMPHEQRGDGLQLIHALPTTPQFWKENGKIFISLPIPDLSTTVCNDDVSKLLEKMHKLILQNKRICLHCQAGEGRSFIVFMSYLSAYGTAQRNPHHFNNYSDALAYVKEKRPQVSATETRKNKILGIATNHALRIESEMAHQKQNAHPLLAPVLN